MITKDIRQNYAKLLEEINDFFKYTGDDQLQDINDFFTDLKNIKDAVEQGAKKADPYWLILPREEGLFEIDANSRKITIPADFARNGVGVQGDELAEIVYFSIDRYFDITDLYDKEIFVQWEAPNGDPGLSVTINKTLNYAPGKVVFGWPITQEMTKEPGNIKFAVRFYERDTSDKQHPFLTYSFGTLTSTIKINSALDFDIADPDAISKSIIDKNKQIYDNLRSSKAIGIDTPAADPIFDTDVFTPAQKDEYEVGQVFKGRAKFDNTIKDEPASKGTISYSWTHVNRDGKKEEISDTPNYEKLEEGTVLSDLDQYYTLEGANYVIYNGASPVPTGTSVFKRFATCQGQKSGQYYLIAINFAGRGNSASTECETPWVIAFAKLPTFTITNRSGIIRDINNGVDISIEVKSDDNGTFKYQWKRSDSNDGEYSDIAEANSNTLNVKQVGYYKLQATNTKNNDEAVALSDAIRVTMPASEIKNIKFEVNGELHNPGDDNIYVTKGTMVKVIYDDLEYSDQVHYKWTFRDNDVSSNQDCLVSNGGKYEVIITNSYNGDSFISSVQPITIFIEE